jgi:hypothetical protein
LQVTRDGGGDKEDPGTDHHAHVKSDPFFQTEGAKQLRLFRFMLAHWRFLACENMAGFVYSKNIRDSRGKDKQNGHL